MTAYGSIHYERKVVLPYFPICGRASAGLEVRLVYYKEKYEEELYKIVKKVIEDGLTYPFESLDTVHEFRAYFLSHECFVCVDKEDKVLGGFYIKPNFPGRCSHVCNGGFVVAEEFRVSGIGSFMCPLYLKIARDLGFEVSFFNLVFVSNEGSIKLWEKFGFQAVGRLPKAGKLKGLGYVDALQYYYDLTTLPRIEGLGGQ